MSGFIGEMEGKIFISNKLDLPVQTPSDSPFPFGGFVLFYVETNP